MKWVLVEVFTNPHVSGPQPFQHQAPVSWKMIFPQTRQGRDGFRMIQTYDIYYIFYFFYYYISSTSNHQALDPGGWDPCMWSQHPQKVLPCCLHAGGLVAQLCPALATPTQGLNPGLLHCRKILYDLSYQGSTMWVSWSENRSVVSDSLRPDGLNSPGQNTGVGSLSLLQGIFPTQGSNPGLPHWRQILYQLSHQGSPRTLE